MFNTSSVCAVSRQARTLVAQRACKDKHRFFVGTCSTHEDNDISILQYYDDSNHFEIATTYAHNDQVWAIEPSPKDTSLIVSSRESSVGLKSLTLWRLPDQTPEQISDDQRVGLSHDHLEMEEIATINQSQTGSVVTSVKWHHIADRILTADNKTLSTWNIRDSSVERGNSMILGFQGESRSAESDFVFPAAVAWDPHHDHLCAVGFDSQLQLVDSREMEVTNTRARAHQGCTVRDVDFNPNKPFTLLSSGDDRTVRFWDLRKFDQPIKTLLGHTHWIWTARYNPYHDQLVLSGGSDHLINLWRIASVSSSPWIGSGEGDDDPEAERDPADIKVRAIDQHEDSVYAVAWSAADAWIYASLSFDGRVIVNHVPSTEKYKILL